MRDVRGRKKQQQSKEYTYSSYRDVITFISLLN